jgi:hypothetical protein
MSDAQFFNRKAPYATEFLTVSTGTSQLTSALRKNTAQQAGNANYWSFTQPATVVTVELVGSNGIIYTLDGSTPTATNGNRLATGGDTLTVAGQQKIANLKMIRSGGSDATVNVSYYKEL